MGSGAGPGGAGQVNITLTGEVKAAACRAASSRSPGIPNPPTSLFIFVRLGNSSAMTQLACSNSLQALNKGLRKHTKRALQVLKWPQRKCKKVPLPRWAPLHRSLPLYANDVLPIFLKADCAGFNFVPRCKTISPKPLFGMQLYCKQRKCFYRNEGRSVWLCSSDSFVSTSFDFTLFFL